MTTLEQLDRTDARHSSEEIVPPHHIYDVGWRNNFIQVWLGTSGRLFNRLGVGKESFAMAAADSGGRMSDGTSVSQEAE